MEKWLYVSIAAGRKSGAAYFITGCGFTCVQGVHPAGGEKRPFLRYQDMSGAAGLLAQCELARREGRDFPTIWISILKTHPLVRGLPRHEIEEGEPLIIVPLLGGQDLVSSVRGFRIR